MNRMPSSSSSSTSSATSSPSAQSSRQEDTASGSSPHDATGGSDTSDGNGAAVAHPTMPNDGSNDAGDCNLLVAGLPRDVGEQQLRAMFEAIGEVKQAIVMYKANTASSRGFGFVLFARKDDAMRAIDALDGALCGANIISVRESRHDGHIVESDAVFVRNIPRTASAELVRAVIQHGSSDAVATVDLSPGNHGAVVSATVQLTSVAAARRCIERLHRVSFASVVQQLGAHAAGNALRATDDASLPNRTVPDMLVKFAESESSLTRRKATRPRGDRRERSFNDRSRGRARSVGGMRDSRRSVAPTPARSASNPPVSSSGPSAWQAGYLLPLPAGVPMPPPGYAAGGMLHGPPLLPPYYPYAGHYHFGGVHTWAASAPQHGGGVAAPHPHGALPTQMQHAYAHPFFGHHGQHVPPTTTSTPPGGSSA